MDSELPVGPAPPNLPPVTGPQHYHVQFSTVEEHVNLVERAKALMARERPGVSLGELYLQAMKLLVASLEKQKFAAGSTSRPRRRVNLEARGRSAESDPHPSQRGDPKPRQRGDSELHERHATSQRGYSERRGRQESETSQCGADLESFSDAAPSTQPGGADRAANAAPESLQRRSRHIPAALRRQVYERDAGRCTYVDVRGARCCETRYLELHHLQPFAKGGSHQPSNLALRCTAHNRLAAEQDFGADLVLARREGARHEAESKQVAT